MEYIGLESAGGALLGVVTVNYATGQLGSLKTLASYLPASNAGFMLLNAAGGVGVMYYIGGAPLDARTAMIAGGVSVAYHVAVGMLSADMQNMLNGNK